MFEPKSDDPSGDNASGRLGKLAFVVGDPNEAPSEGNEPRLASGDEDAQWLNERLTACYND